MVHPAKYNFHRVPINNLLKKGHEVEVLIQKKDVLTELVKSEKWRYHNF